MRAALGVDRDARGAERLDVAMDRADRDLELARPARTRSSRRGPGAAGGARRASTRACPDATKRRHSVSGISVRFAPIVAVLGSRASIGVRAYDLRVTSDDAPRPVLEGDGTDATRPPAATRPSTETLAPGSAPGSPRSISTPRLLHTLAEPGLRGADADPDRGDPAAARRQGPAGRGAHRHGQDRRVRAARPEPAGDPARRAARPGPARPTARGAPRLGEKGQPAQVARPHADPRAGDAGRRGDAQATAASLARASCPCTAASRSPRSSTGSRGASTSSSRRRAARWTTSSAGRSASTRSRPSCSTRPTRCSTWASPTTWSGSSDPLPEVHQTALFSATISGPIARLAGRHLRHPVQVRVQSEATAGEASRVRQVAYVVRRADKLAALGRILDLEDGTATLVFARTRGEVDDLAEALSGRGRDAAALHGGLAQEQRDRIMGRFRDGALDVLVATDVAARGLDIEQVTHVVNYDVPSSPDVYVHRIGRTGRAGPRGCRDHAGRAARAPAAARHRADDRRAARARRAARRSPTSARSGSRSCAARCARRCSATASTATARSSSRCRTSSTSSTSRSPRSASPTQEARGAEDTAELAPATLPPAFGERGPGDRGGPDGARSPPSPAGATQWEAPGRRPPPRRRRPAAVRAAAAGRWRRGEQGGGDGRRPRPASPGPARRLRARPRATA